MKNIIIFAMLLVSANTVAQEAERDMASKENPQHIERMRDGKVEKYDGDEWIIVKRGPKKPKAKPAPAPVCEPKVVEKTVTVEKAVTIEKTTYRKNRISLLAGQGPTSGVDVSNSGPTMQVSSRVGAVGGVQYQRSLTDRWSLGLQLQTNPSCMIDVGYDF